MAVRVTGTGQAGAEPAGGRKKATTAAQPRPSESRSPSEPRPTSSATDTVTLSPAAQAGRPEHARQAEAREVESENQVSASPALEDVELALQTAKKVGLSIKRSEEQALAAHALLDSAAVDALLGD